MPPTALYLGSTEMSLSLCSRKYGLSRPDNVDQHQVSQHLLYNLADIFRRTIWLASRASGSSWRATRADSRVCAPRYRSSYSATDVDVVTSSPLYFVTTRSISYSVRAKEFSSEASNDYYVVLRAAGSSIYSGLKFRIVRRPFY